MAIGGRESGLNVDDRGSNLGLRKVRLVEVCKNTEGD